MPTLHQTIVRPVITEKTSEAYQTKGEYTFEVANDALQIFGGYGYDQDAAVNYMFRRTRGWMIAGGSIEQLLNRVANDVFGETFSQRPPRSS